MEAPAQIDIEKLWQLKWDEHQRQKIFSSSVADFEVKWHALDPESGLSLMLRHNRNFAVNVRLKDNACRKGPASSKETGLSRSVSLLIRRLSTFANQMSERTRLSLANRCLRST